MTTFPQSLPGSSAPVRMWLPTHELEPTAADQVRAMSRVPGIEGIAIMPDAHAGKGAVVGSVIAMRDAVMPSAVGVDIGCGMTAVQTSLSLADLPDDLGPLRKGIEGAVPVGFSAHSGHAPILSNPHHRRLRARTDRLFGSFERLTAPGVNTLEGRAIAQCGTLGGGNHFIEVCADERGLVWLTLHSGSRNIGKSLAERHIEKAKTLEWNAGLPDPELAVFIRNNPDGTVADEWNNYMRDLFWAQDYAALNREVMLATVQSVLASALPGVKFGDRVSCHHNYVAKENYDGVDLVVTRKGAINADRGTHGIIPGSMGTGSYIVRGLGYELAYRSASHGAGRRLSRGAAKRQFTIDDAATQTAGVECRKDAGILDELPGAYKDIESVMSYQADLVTPVARLTTLLCVKG